MTPTGDYRVETLPSGPAFAAVLAELHGACFARSPQEPWSSSAIATLLGAPGTTGLMALTPDDVAIGFIIGRLVADEVEILTVCVSPSFRCRGVATALIGELADTLSPTRRIVLEVAITNRGARDLYESLGFEEVGRRADYYRRDGKATDALILARDACG